MESEITPIIPSPSRADSLKNLFDSINHIKEEIAQYLGAGTKDIEINFMGQDFNFYYPTTPEEKEQQKELIQDFCNKLIIKSLCDLLESGKFESLNLIEAIFSGPDYRDFQLEYIEQELSDEDKAAIEQKKQTGVPLDLDSYYVQSQDDRKYQEGVIDEQQNT